MLPILRRIGSVRGTRESDTYIGKVLWWFGSAHEWEWGRKPARAARSSGLGMLAASSPFLQHLSRHLLRIMNLADCLQVFAAADRRPQAGSEIVPSLARIF